MSLGYSVIKKFNKKKLDFLSFYFNYNGIAGYCVSEKHSIWSDDLGVIREECGLKIGTFK